MIKSMTGFGTHISEQGAIKVTVEIKSLNSKFLELNLKLPKAYNDQEIFIRNECSRLIERGKVNLSINLEKTKGNTQSASINEELARDYYRKLATLAASLNANTDDLFKQVLQMPEVVSISEGAADEEEWKLIMSTFQKAFQAYDRFRMDEGNALAEDLKLRIHNILSFLEQVSLEEPKRIPQIKERLSQLLADAVESINVDQNRLEQELIFYVEKYDITEEKVRLRTHCDYFLETMKGDASNGKKLAFITQEIGREINTMGAKANAVSIQQLVVGMKDELEKIKEQLNNVL